MRLFRFLVLVVLLAIVGRLAVRTVSVESTGDTLQITLDKRKLEETGREAAGKVGAALERAGRKLDGGPDEQDARR
jgi:hypothetical protein